MTSRAKWYGLLVAVLVVGYFGQTLVTEAQGGNRVYTPLVMAVKNAPTPTPIPQPTAEPPSNFEQRVIDLTNQQRVANGCAPFRTESHLMAAAEAHSRDMADNDFFSHTGSDGSAPWDRMTRAGYSWGAAAENIAAGYSTPEDVVQGWMNSPGHRANILNCDLHDIGVGYVLQDPDTGDVNYRHYWTQDFGTPR